MHNNIPPRIKTDIMSGRSSSTRSRAGVGWAVVPSGSIWYHLLSSSCYLRPLIITPPHRNLFVFTFFGRNPPPPPIPCFQFGFAGEIGGAPRVLSMAVCVQSIMGVQITPLPPYSVRRHGRKQRQWRRSERRTPSAAPLPNVHRREKKNGCLIEEYYRC
jgi:hypothetical protein